MTCAEMQAELSLYLYGELDFSTEELLELHLLDCAFCQLALNREKQWHAALNRQQNDVPPEFLTACRENLFRQVAREPNTAAQTGARLAGWLKSFFDVRLTSRSYRLAGISFLLLMGFAAGRLFHPSLISGKQTLMENAGLLPSPETRVQEIQPESGNRVRIVLQQMQTRVVAGNRDDDGVRQILVGAIRRSQDPGVRIDSVEMLSGQANLEIRNTLVNSIRNDPNAAVRAKAVDSLRKFPADADTRNVLEYALAHDKDAGVRAEAMDVLVPAEGHLELTPQLMEILTEVLRSPQADDYVRGRCAQVLHHPALSNDTY